MRRLPRNGPRLVMTPVAACAAGRHGDDVCDDARQTSATIKPVPSTGRQNQDVADG